jgi:ribosomal protein S18 acetylase RimI-like enzyme
LAIDPSKIVVRLLTSDTDVADFKCGDQDWEREVAAFLQEDALREQSDGLNKTWVFSHANECIGYVSLLASSLRPQADSTIPDVGYPEAPCVMIGQLGVHEGFQGQGMGKTILYWVIEQATESSFGVRFLTLHVDRGNARAQDFYESHDFRRIRGLSDSAHRFMLLDLHLPGHAPYIDGII